MLALETSSIAIVTGAFTWTHISREILCVSHNTINKLIQNYILCLVGEIGLLQIS